MGVVVLTQLINPTSLSGAPDPCPSPPADLGPAEVGCAGQPCTGLPPHPSAGSMRPVNIGTSPDAGAVGNGCPLSPIKVPTELKERETATIPLCLITAGHKISYHLSRL